MKYLILPALLLTAACNNTPAQKETAKTTQSAGDDEVKAQKKSIEEAADEAAKLVEDDARAEIDAQTPPEKAAGK